MTGLGVLGSSIAILGLARCSRRRRRDSGKTGEWRHSDLLPGQEQVREAAETVWAGGGWGLGGFGHLHSALRPGDQRLAK